MEQYRFSCHTTACLESSSKVQSPARQLQAEKIRVKPGTQLHILPISTNSSGVYLSWNTVRLASVRKKIHSPQLPLLAITGASLEAASCFLLDG